MHFADRRINALLHSKNVDSRAVSSDLHSKQRPLAAGFKAHRTCYYITAWSACAIDRSQALNGKLGGGEGGGG